MSIEDIPEIELVRCSNEMKLDLPAVAYNPTSEGDYKSKFLVFKNKKTGKYHLTAHGGTFSHMVSALFFYKKYSPGDIECLRDPEKTSDYFEVDGGGEIEINDKNIIISKKSHRFGMYSEAIVRTILERFVRENHLEKKLIFR